MALLERNAEHSEDREDKRADICRADGTESGTDEVTGFKRSRPT